MYLANKEMVNEVDFFESATILKSKDNEKREKLSPLFYECLSKNKEEFELATTEDVREFKKSGGRSNETTLINTIKAIEKYPSLTDEDEEYLKKVLKALKDGTFPKQTTKVLVQSIKGENNPVKILFKLRHGIAEDFFMAPISGDQYFGSSPREVILSEFLLPKDSK